MCTKEFKGPFLAPQEGWTGVLAKLQVQQLPDGLMPCREIVLFIKDALAFHLRWLPAQICPSSLAPSVAVPRCSCHVKDAEQLALRSPLVPSLQVSLCWITGSRACLAKGGLECLWHCVCFSSVLEHICQRFALMFRSLGCSHQWFWSAY